MVLKQFYRQDRKYWYKLIILKGVFYIMYDFRQGKVGGRMKLLDHNKYYAFATIDEALETFNNWKKRYE